MKDKFYEVEEIISIRDMIEKSCMKAPNKAAFLAKEKKGGEYKEISYKQFKEDVENLGTYLIDKGLQGEKVAIIGANSYQWVLAYAAVVTSGGVAVPLDKELNDYEIKNLVETAGCRGAFFTEEYEDAFKDLNIDYKYIMSSYQKEEDVFMKDHLQSLIKKGLLLRIEGIKKYQEHVPNIDEMAVILFTSGTTGAPKGVMLSQRNIIVVLMDTARIFQLQEDDVALSVLPIHHTFECTIDILEILYQGHTIAFFEGLKYVQANLLEAKASVIVGVPLIVESLYDKIWKQAKKTKKDKLLRGLIATNKKMEKLGINKRRSLFKAVYKNLGGNLRLFISGAAAIKPEIVRGLLDLGFDVAQGYGLTETAPLISGTPGFEREKIYLKAGSCGQCIPGGQVKIMNPGEDGIGEIAYKGENVMLGYYNMPEETAKVIKDGWFYTGDLGFIDEQGWIYITGRAKNVIVTKTGKNIYPEELEALLHECPYIKESLVYGKEEDNGVDYIVAAQIIPDYDYLREKNNITEDEEEKIYNVMKDQVHNINEKLSSYKRVRNILIRKEDFVRTTTKKIKRQENL